MNNSIMADIRNTINQVVAANQHYFEIWKDHILFTWQWWLQLFLMILPVFFLLFFGKKQSTTRMWLSGLFVLLISSWLDFIGNSYGLWFYPFKFIPSIPPLIPWNEMFAIEVMVLLAYKPHFSPIAKAIIMSVLNAIVIEQLTVWLGLYEPVKWNTLYSVPIYIAIYLIAHRISRSQPFAPLVNSSSQEDTTVPYRLSELILMSKEWSNAERGRDLMKYISIFFQEVLNIDTGFFVYQGMFIRQVPPDIYSPWGAFAEEAKVMGSIANGIKLETLPSLPYIERWVSHDKLFHRDSSLFPFIEEISIWPMYVRNRCVGAIVLGRKQPQEKLDEKYMHLYMTHIALIWELFAELRIEREKKFHIG